jgi:choline dehydrogenase-like flavoprotein
MNLTAMRRYATTETVDAVVIGTGAGGAPLLAQLARAGLKVVALEAGQNWDPETFPAEETATGIYWMNERLSAGATPEAFGANNSGTGVGGSTLHWGAFVPRADPRDLRKRTACGIGEDWPISYADLAPYYDRVEAFIGVSGPQSYPWDPARRYPLPPVPRNAPAQMMAKGCDALGIRTADAPAAVLSRDFAQDGGSTRPACINCGYCHQGCRIGAKTSMDVTYLPQAIAHGAEIRPDSFVHDLERDRTGRITAVIYRAGGIDIRQKCNTVFLCAGAIETPRLLLHLDLANASGQVGRNYMAHVATQVWGSFDRDMRCNKGYPSSLITEDTLGAGYLMQSLGVVPVTWANGVARGRGLWGQALVDYIQSYNHVAGIGINGDCLPQPGNYLALSNETDATGFYKPIIHFSYGPHERAIDEHATKLMTEIWQNAGATDIWSLQRSAHTIGTCRMGPNGDSAVVDHTGRSFDIENLWICDNSVFPSALAANPALTIMALSLRTADAYLARDT